MNPSHPQYPLWRKSLSDLESWHQCRDRRAATAALTFFEVQFRATIPPAVRRRWPPEQVDDAIQAFLQRLLERPLPPQIDDPKAYLLRAFANACIDIERGRRRRPAEPCEDIEELPTSEDPSDAKDRLLALESRLREMRIEDRVALKMVDAPLTLTDDEFAWLARRAGLAENEVRKRVLAHPPVYDLTFLFDPGPPSADASERRDRMERFRKRRERARKAILRNAGGDA